MLHAYIYLIILYGRTLFCLSHFSDIRIAKSCHLGIVSKVVVDISISDILVLFLYIKCYLSRFRPEYPVENFKFGFCYLLDMLQFADRDSFWKYLDS